MQRILFYTPKTGFWCHDFTWCIFLYGKCEKIHGVRWNDFSVKESFLPFETCVGGHYPGMGPVSAKEGSFVMILHPKVCVSLKQAMTPELRRYSHMKC